VLGQHKNLNKPYLYDLFKSWLGNGLLTSRGSKWINDRKMLIPVFHFSILDNYMVVMIEKTQIMINRIEEELTKNPGKEINVYPLICNFGLDVICGMFIKIYLLSCFIFLFHILSWKKLKSHFWLQFNRKFCKKKKNSFIKISLN
ncbi:hypothetical protein M0802_016984, partial [Mischocyttarus mexicanus]